MVELLLFEYHWNEGVTLELLNTTVKVVGVPLRHTVLGEGCVVIVGAGLTVTITVKGVPEQVPSFGVTV